MNRKVLIVEDEYIVAKNLRLILEQAGYKINGIAASAKEAYENLEIRKPDLVLLDIRLEGKESGIDLARKLKSDNIAFIYLSANSNQKILEEAKTTEPYGFLVKPFRKKDLLITLDIAWYRHMHSIESKLRQEEILKKQLAELENESSAIEQKLLKIARLLQSYIPFDLFVSGFRPLNTAQFNDTGYLRIGFDEYQLIGKKELLTITGLKENSFSVVVEKSDTDSATIYNDGVTKEKPGITSLRKILLDTFNLKSYIVFPVTLSNGRSVLYYFYSRQGNIYTADHVALLDRLKMFLKDITEKMYREPSSTSLIMQPGSAAQNYSEVAGSPVFKSIIGNHHLLLKALDLTAQVAPYNTSVLILGESGTGKEKIAQAIHTLSSRRNKPFIKVNCAAIPPTLIESELFGHEKGAFTGAIEKRKGKFEQADEGTIFLDEIGELPLGMQVKLLRVLQEKEIEHVGGDSPVKLNVRIVAATNRNLEKEVSEGKFRLDLYYRLNVFPITLPALRERESDIETLALFFADSFSKEFNKPFTGISESMMKDLLAYNWPGNVRELENVLEQSVILNDGKSKLELKRSLTDQQAKLTGKLPIKTLEDVKHFQRETEREYVISILKKTKGRIRGINGAAELLNIKPSTLESKMVKLNIKREDL
ncbi:MAG TPA: sigma 54-interacting transcriptional regulator [Chitinophagaceae bacterium]|nr:sigma 54-interacting transcriptional regulator [Chitinophagaceae bacterium]